MKQKRYIILTLVLIAVIGAGAVWRNRGGGAPQKRSAPLSSDSVRQQVPDDSVAEMTGYGFIQNVIKSAPPQADAAAMEQAYNALSFRARSRVSRDSLSRDLAGFLKIQDVPDRGASVENLKKGSGQNAVLTVGLNYSGGRVLRDVELVVENGTWKVDAVQEAEGP